MNTTATINVIGQMSDEDIMASMRRWHTLQHQLNGYPICKVELVNDKTSSSLRIHDGALRTSVLQTAVNEPDHHAPSCSDDLDSKSEEN